MNAPSPMMERLIAGITLGLAFLVMASIIVPDPTVADEPHDALDHGTTPEGATRHGVHADAAAEGVDHGDPAATVASTDAHAGLRSLGSLESNGLIVEFFATEQGARYTICDAETGQELGTLLTLEQVERYHPDVPLPGLDFSATSSLMLAEPVDFPVEW